MEMVVDSVKQSEADLIDWLKTVKDPELGLALTELGLIYGVTLSGDGQALVRMTLTSPACPMADVMINDIKSRLVEHADVQGVQVEIVWDPKWDPATMASEDAKEELGIW